MVDTVKDALNSANPNDFPARCQQVKLGDALSGMAPDGAVTNGWQAAVAVATDVVKLPLPGRVISVEGTTGNTVGPKSIIQSGTPAVLQVDVKYDAAGIPTLTFNGTDAITVCAVDQLTVGATLRATLDTEL